MALIAIGRAMLKPNTGDAGAPMGKEISGGI